MPTAYTTRLARLEAAELARQAPPPPDEVLRAAQAVACIVLSVAARLRARCADRRQRVRPNEQDWGCLRSVLDKYPRRYYRAAQAA